jgi:hypothetical protein
VQEKPSQSQFSMNQQTTDTRSLSRVHFGTTEIQEWLLAFGTREDLICWLVWNDGNGVYTDSDSIAEGYEPLSLELARETMRSILDRDL